MKNITAYHVYYQSKDFGKYYEIDLLIQLASILFWKKNYGPIKLYCNQKFLETLQKYNLDQHYDEINTTLLENIPYKPYLPKYWSFCKLHAIKHISNIDEEFVILDTDLFIMKDLGIDFNYDLILYHPEIFKENQEQKTYMPPETFLPQEEINQYNWDVLPTNAAFLYINNKEFVNRWYEWVLRVIESNKDKPKLDYSADTVFIEQRLLPTLANKMGLKLDFVFNSMYKTWIDGSDDLSEWEPKLDSTEELRFKMDNSKHIWGLKNNYHRKEIRDLVLWVVISNLKENFNMEIIEDLYDKLFKDCYNIWNDPYDNER